MNARIQELVQAAEYWANTFEDKSKYQEYLMKTFAGLIVQECIDHLEGNVLVPNIEHLQTKTKCIKAIKEHFGVE